MPSLAKEVFFGGKNILGESDFQNHTVSKYLYLILFISFIMVLFCQFQEVWEFLIGNAHTRMLVFKYSSLVTQTVAFESCILDV